VIQTYRATHANVLPVNGGGWAMGGTMESQKTQSLFLMDAMGKMGYPVVNVTPVDLTYGVETLRQAALKNKIQLVASNLRSKAKDAYVFEPYVVLNEMGIRVAFLGLMEEGEPLSPLTTEGDDLMTVDPADAVRALLPEVRTKADVVVVFAHLTQRKTQQLVDDVKGIDIAVSGKDGFVNYKPTEVGGDSTGADSMASKSLVLEAGERGKYLGALTFVVSEHGKILRYNHEIHSLDKNVKDDSLMALAVTDLKARLADVRKREAVEQAVGANNQANTPHEKFLGAQVCARCHQAAFDSWKASPHANSMAVLEAKAMEGSADCLKCHVTGFNQPSGYPNSSTELGNVSCEQCHGLGTLHGDKTFVVHPAAQSCTVCHDQKNSPHFDYKAYWSKIAH
jgi:2',3'-cyclic-nucleotide 2'-phosphodiesterase (5'-nucleotidase family)